MNITPKVVKQWSYLAVGLCLGLVALASPALAQVGSDVKLTPFRPEIVVGFDNERSTQTRSLTFDLSSPTTESPAAVVLGDFTSVTGPHVETADAVVATVTLDPDSETARLEVAVTPTLSAWKAGEFTSSIRVGGSGFEAVIIPLKLTFRTGPSVTGPLVALGVLMLGLLVGLLFKSNESKPVETTATGARKQVTLWAKRSTAILTAVTVVVFGFDTQYLDSSTFGAGGFSDWLALFAWGFAAGFSAKTVSSYMTTKAV